jgi:hypothetical protein
MGTLLAVGSRGAILESGPVIHLSFEPSRTDQLSLWLEGPTGLDYTIQSSTDPVSWQN